MSKAVATPLKLLVVAIIYIVVGALLYRQRIISHIATWNSDFLVFYLPALLAVAANGWIIGASFPPGLPTVVRGTVTCVLAIAATLIAASIYASIVFSAYGT